MKYAIEMVSCDTVYIPSFMNIGTGFQAIVRFCLRNLNGCNVDIIEGRSMPLRWVQLP
jgi:hypothetical protein